MSDKDGDGVLNCNEVFLLLKGIQMVQTEDFATVMHGDLIGFSEFKCFKAGDAQAGLEASLLKVPMSHEELQSARDALEAGMAQDDLQMARDALEATILEASSLDVPMSHEELQRARDALEASMGQDDLQMARDALEASMNQAGEVSKE